MRLILRSSLKELRRLRRDPISLGLWVGIPLLIGLVLVALFGRGEPRPQGLLLIADQDATFISSLVGNAYTQGKLGEMISVEKVPLEEGRKRIKAGKGSALLVIPKGFTEAVLRNEAVKLELVTNPSQAILPGIIKETTSILVEGAWYLHQFVGDDLQRFADAGDSPPEELVAGFSVRIKRFIDAYSGSLDPPLIDVSSEVVQEGPARSLNMAVLMFPCMVFMTVMFLAFGAAGDAWREKTSGTLRRMAVTPGSTTCFLAGKVLTLAAVYVLVAAVAIAASAFLLGMPVRNPAMAVLWIVATGGGFYLLLLLLVMTAPTERAASVLGNLAVMVFAMIGGSFFPFEIMPDFMSRIGRLTPNGWALLRLREILSGEASPASLAMSFGALLTAGGVFFFVADRWMRRRFVL